MSKNHLNPLMYINKLLYIYIKGSSTFLLDFVNKKRFKIVDLSEWEYWLWIIVYAVLGNTTFRIWELNVAVTTSQRVSTVTHLFALQLKYICECENGTKIFLKSNLNYYLHLKDPQLFSKICSCQISSFATFFYTKFNWIRLNEG